jgi:predicted phage gp36 major capsid-like protein
MRSCSSSKPPTSEVGYTTGRRGLFAYARIGSDCVDTSAFRLLVANS